MAFRRKKNRPTAESLSFDDEFHAKLFFSFNFFWFFALLFVNSPKLVPAAVRNIEPSVVNMARVLIRIGLNFYSFPPGKSERNSLREMAFIYRIRNAREITIQICCLCLSFRGMIEGELNANQQ